MPRNGDRLKVDGTDEAARTDAMADERKHGLIGLDEAVRLGHRVVGPEHILLALMGDVPDLYAHDVLTSLGALPDTVEQVVREGFKQASADDEERERRDLEAGNIFASSPKLNPRYYVTMGRALGFAAWRHEGPADSLDWLLALLWDGGRWVLDQQGINRAVVLNALQAASVELPVALMPPDETPLLTPRRFDIPTTSVPEVVRLLNERYPPSSGLRWGFNYGASNSWIIAEDGVDLQSILLEVGLADDAGTPLEEGA